MIDIAGVDHVQNGRDYDTFPVDYYAESLTDGHLSFFIVGLVLPFWAIVGGFAGWLAIIICIPVPLEDIIPSTSVNTI